MPRTKIVDLKVDDQIVNYETKEIYQNCI